MTERGEKILMLAAAAFLICVLLTMGYVIRYSNAKEQTDDVQPVSEMTETEYFTALESAEADIIIRLPDQEAQEQFQIEENLKNKTIEITLPDVEQDYYQVHKVQGNIEKISQVKCQQKQGASCIKFVLRDYYVAASKIDGTYLYLTLEDPIEQYDKYVVLEGDGFTTEVQDVLEAAGIKGFTTGDLATANGIRADMFVGLSMDTTADETAIKIYYDDDYAIPLFDSRALADLLAEAFTAQYDRQQVSVLKTEDLELSDAIVPAVRVVCSMAATDGEEVPAEVWQNRREENAEVIVDAVIRQYQEMEENK